MRTRIRFPDDDYSKVDFIATDLWLDQATIPDLWNNSVLSDHLAVDPFAHDWRIIKSESYIHCEESVSSTGSSSNSCQVNLRFFRDFNTEDNRDHQLQMGSE